MKNRLELISLLYKDYVILILIKKKLYIYENNELSSFKDFNKLKKLHINYIILDNIDIIKEEYKDNKYLEYYLKYNLNNILNNILVRMRG